MTCSRHYIQWNEQFNKQNSTAYRNNYFTQNPKCSTFVFVISCILCQLGPGMVTFHEMWISFIIGINRHSKTSSSKQTWTTPYFSIKSHLYVRPDPDEHKDGIFMGKYGVIQVWFDKVVMLWGPIQVSLLII